MVPCCLCGDSVFDGRTGSVKAHVVSHQSPLLGSGAANGPSPHQLEICKPPGNHDGSPHTGHVLVKGLVSRTILDLTSVSM